MDRELKKPKRTMTEAQKKARMANLANGRKKRMEMLQKKKETGVPEEYDIDSDESSIASGSSDSDSDNAFVISKKKKKTPKKAVNFALGGPKQGIISTKPSKHEGALKRDVDELKNIVVELVTLQKQQNKAVKKARKQTNRSSGGTKIVVLPQQNPAPQTKSSNDSMMDALRKSLMS